MNVLSLIYSGLLAFFVLTVPIGIHVLMAGWRRYLRLAQARRVLSERWLAALAVGGKTEDFVAAQLAGWAAALPGVGMALLRYDATAAAMYAWPAGAGNGDRAGLSLPAQLPAWPPAGWGAVDGADVWRLTEHFSDAWRHGRWPAAGGGRWNTAALAVPVRQGDLLHGVLVLDLSSLGWPEAGLLQEMAEGSVLALSLFLRRCSLESADLLMGENHFFESAPVPMLIFDRSHRVMRLNAQARSLSGVSQAVTPEQRHCGVFCREQCLGGECPMRNTLEHGERMRQRMDLFGVTFEAVTTPLYRDGRLAGGMLALIDVTELISSQRHVRETSELLSTVLEILPCMVLVKEAGVDGRCLIGNRYLHEFLGRGAGELPGLTDREIFGDEVAEQFAGQDAQAMAQGMLEVYQKYLGLNGQIAYLHTFKVRIPRGTGMDLLLTISFDVTEITLARKELERHERELQQANADLRQYLQLSQTLRDCTEHLVTDLYSEGAMQMLVESIGRMLAIDLCAVVEYVGEDSVSHAVWRAGDEAAAAGTEDLAAPFAPITRGRPRVRSEIGGSGVLAAKRGEATGDAALDRELDDFFLVSGVSSILCYRILFNGKVWGHFGCLCRGRRELSQAEQHGIRDAGRVVELILIRQALMEQLGRKEEQLSLALDAAQGSVQAKSMFLATMSHEIRTPLNAVIGFSELLKNPDVSARERQEYTTGIAHAGNALLQLINDILDLSKMESGKFELPAGHCSLPQLLAEIQAIFSGKAQEKGIDFRVLYDPRLPLLSLNEQRMRQVLLNLVGNAMKFTVSGHITCRADFSGTANGPEPERGRLCIEVEDSGMGIEEKSREKIFDPFIQQGNGVRGSRVFEGTGLGLPIAKRMVEKMGGSITLLSEVGRGSTFTIVIPEVETIVLERLGLPSQPDEAPLSGSGTPAGLRVLLVDDIKVNLRVLSGYLQRLQVNCHAVSSGAEALAYLRSHPCPDLVMTDMWMPGMNGAELAAEIHALPGLADLPIVAVTADIEVGDNFDVGHFGAVLHKPLSPGKVRKVLALARRRRREEDPQEEGEGVARS